MDTKKHEFVSRVLRVHSCLFVVQKGLEGHPARRRAPRALDSAPYLHYGNDIVKSAPLRSRFCPGTLYLLAI